MDRRTWTERQRQRQRGMIRALLIHINHNMSSKSNQMHFQELSDLLLSTIHITKGHTGQISNPCY